MKIMLSDVKYWFSEMIPWNGGTHNKRWTVDKPKDLLNNDVNLLSVLLE